MNLIIGRMLKFLTEEEAFWVFAMLIETILPIDYYCLMIGVQADVKIFKKLVEVFLPDIAWKFRELQFDPIFFSLNWFVCLFTDKLQEEVPTPFNFARSV